MRARAKLTLDPMATVADMRAGECSFCHKTLTADRARDDWGCVSFYRYKDGELFYPFGSEEGIPIAMFTHAECGPDVGYWLGFDRFLGLSTKDRDAEYGMRAHIASKFGHSLEFDRGLILAHEFINRPKPKRPKPSRIVADALKSLPPKDAIDVLAEVAGEIAAKAGKDPF